MSYVKETLERHLEYIAKDIKDKEDDIARYEKSISSSKKVLAELYTAQTELNEAIKEYK